MRLHELEAGALAIGLLGPQGSFAAVAIVIMDPSHHASRPIFELEDFSGVAQVPFEVANDVGDFPRRCQVRLVARDDQVAPGGNHRFFGKGELDARAESPAAQVHPVDSRVVKLQELLFGFIPDRVIVNLAKKDVVFPRTPELFSSLGSSAQPKCQDQR